MKTFHSAHVPQKPHSRKHPWWQVGIWVQAPGALPRAMPTSWIPLEDLHMEFVPLLISHSQRQVSQSQSVWSLLSVLPTSPNFRPLFDPSQTIQKHKRRAWCCVRLDQLGTWAWELLWQPKQIYEIGAEKNGIAIKGSMDTLHKPWGLSYKPHLSFPVECTLDSTVIAISSQRESIPFKVT